MGGVSRRVVEVMATKHYVEFSYPGSFFPEHSTREIASRDDVGDLPERAFCYEIYDREEVTLDGEVLRGEAKNKSGRFYIGGELFSVERLKAELPDHDILISNIEQHDEQMAIKCRTGNWQPFFKGDSIVVPA